MNLKIARMQEYFTRLETSAAAPQPTPAHLVGAVRHLTEICLRCRMQLWFNFRHVPFIHQFCSFAQSLSPAFDARQSVVLVWMLSKLGRMAFKSPADANPMKSFLTQLLRQLLAKDNCSEMQTHDLMLLVNGLANLDCTQVPYILDACLPNLMKGMGEMNPSTFALFIWSYGKLGYSPTDPEIQKRLMRECEAKDAKMTVQQMGSVAWGLCRMEFPEASLYLAKHSARVHGSLSDFVPLGISRFMEACLLMNHNPGDAVLRMLANRFSHFRGYATPGLCYQALPAFAYFVQFPEMMFTYSYQAMTERYPQLMEPEERIRILSAYSLADTLSPRFFESTIHALLTQGSYEDLPGSLLRELWISFITHRTHFGHRVKNVIPKKLMTLMRNAWKEGMASEAPHSLASDIQSSLKEINVTCSVGYSEPEIAVSADLVCQWAQKRVVLFVVDTPDVFSNLPRRLNGQYLWKERQFLKLGYGAGRIPAVKWQLLDGLAAKHSYLSYVLKKHRAQEGDTFSRSELSRVQEMHSIIC